MGDEIADSSTLASHRHELLHTKSDRSRKSQHTHQDPPTKKGKVVRVDGQDDINLEQKNEDREAQFRKKSQNASVGKKRTSG